MHHEDIKVFSENLSRPSKVSADREEDSKTEPLLGSRRDFDFKTIMTTWIAGVIDKFDTLRLQMLIFRATRGKAIWITEDIETEILKKEGIKRSKTIYLILFQAGDFIYNKIRTICESFLSEIFDLPSDNEYQSELNKVNSQINEWNEVIHKTKIEIKNYFIKVNRQEKFDSNTIKIYEMYIKKEMLVYKTMNKMALEEKLVHGIFWSNLNLQQAHDKILDIQSKHRIEGLKIEEITDKSKLAPPTKIYTNEFIGVFQTIVNTYGIPGYKEVNPALFTIVTFPLLFGMMFGDIAHGLLLFFFATYLWLNKTKIEESASMLKGLLDARYLFLLMGFFATFFGLLYNDFMSIPLELFGGESCYKDSSNLPLEDWVYSFGIDPRWYRSSNKITYINSLKMKMSVIIAITHMSLGVWMKAFNAYYFKSAVDFIFEFVPQIILMLSLFGYMDVLIIIKWLTNYSGVEHEAPSIINTMINIPLKGAYIEGRPFISDLKSNQNISLVLLLIAVLCVPLMLLPKPIILISRQPHSVIRERQSNEKIMQDPEGDKLYFKMDDEKKEDEEDKQDDDYANRDRPSDAINNNNNEHNPALEDNKNNLHGFDGQRMRSDSQLSRNMSEIFEEGTDSSHNGTEIFIHQLIETIEFALGTISNTASYLRLWALSLAHSQLAEVFFELIFWSNVKTQSPIGIFIGFVVFGTVTLSVLMLMDLMECFLHTIRLHWMEFQNKFYKGTGYLFVPLNFKSIQNNEADKA